MTPRQPTCILLNMDSQLWMRAQKPYAHFILTDPPLDMFNRALHDCAHTYIMAGGQTLLRPEGRRIPGEKSWEVYKMLLRLFPHETVVDPFMGTGTIGYAALTLGRDFIGIERDPATYAIAHERLKRWIPTSAPRCS